MGSYGIGVERAMAAIAEVHHDEAGLKWPLQVAPAEVDVIMVSGRDEPVRVASEAIYAALQAAGHDVIIDDRDERPGVKFKDAELIGFPFRVSVGSRDLAEGMVEVVSRETGERERVPVDQVVKHVQDLLPAGPVR
jgi:prolyl-tRNA synthetase